MEIRRRVLFALAASALTAPFGTFAQPKGKVWRIGFLTLSTQTGVATPLDSFKRAFRVLGYEEGRDYSLEPRFAEGIESRLPSLAVELVGLRVDLIMTHAATPTLAAHRATQTIPIVMTSAGDPVGSGVVKSLANPGGNVTGTSNSLTDIAPKHLDLLRDTIPGVSRIVILMNPDLQSHRAALKVIREMAPRIGAEILPVEAQSAEEIQKGFLQMARENAKAPIVVIDPIFLDRRRQIADLATKARLPCAGYSSEFADAGLLIGYGPNRSELFQRAAIYVDKILKGSKPSDLPVEQPTKFELVVNLKTAKAIGIKIPQSVLVRADRVIE